MVHTFNPQHLAQRQVDQCEFEANLYVYSEFQDSWSYIVRPYVKKQNKNWGTSVQGRPYEGGLKKEVGTV